MRILLFGKNGQLGTELQKSLPALGIVTSLDQEELDLCNLQALRRILQESKPHLVINASAYTAVDRAELEPDKAMTINALAPGIMAEETRNLQAVLIHYSTDYVFDGAKNTPYTEDDHTNPLNMYGKSKLAGEQNVMQVGEACLILRTSWVYSIKGTGFVSKVLEWSRNNQILKIVNDQISNPTWARDLADATFRVISAHQDNLQDFMKEKRGVYHLAGGGYTSRYEWAREILANDPKRTEQLVRILEPASSKEFPTPAIRPLFSALDCSKFKNTFGFSLPPWKESLRQAMRE
jgi:dTDP-4-dehydrorhamnose reductase